MLLILYLKRLHCDQRELIAIATAARAVWVLGQRRSDVCCGATLETQNRKNVRAHYGFR